MSAGPVVIGTRLDVDALGADIDQAESKMRAATSSIEGGADSAATKFSTLAGAMGDVAGGLGMIGLGGFSDELEKVAPALMLVAGASDIVAVATTAMNAAWLTSPITWIVVGIVALGAALVIAYKKSETFREIVDKAFAAIRNAVGAVVDFFQAKVIPAAAAYVNAYVTAFQKVMDFAQTARAWIVDKLQAVVGFVKDLPGKITAAASGIWDGITKPFEAAYNWISEKLGWLLDKLDSARDKLSAIPGVGKLLGRVITSDGPVLGRPGPFGPPPGPTFTIQVGVGDPVEIGRAVQKVLDAYYRAGGGQVDY